MISYENEDFQMKVIVTLHPVNWCLMGVAFSPHLYVHTCLAEALPSGSYEKARLRFAHAETVVPFSCLLGLFLQGSGEDNFRISLSCSLSFPLGIFYFLFIYYPGSCILTWCCSLNVLQNIILYWRKNHWNSLQSLPRGELGGEVLWLHLLGTICLYFIAVQPENQASILFKYCIMSIQYLYL